MLHSSRSTDLQVWEQENSCEKSDRITRIDVPQKQWSEMQMDKFSWISFLPCLQNVRF